MEWSTRTMQCCVTIKSDWGGFAQCSIFCLCVWGHSQHLAFKLYDCVIREFISINVCGLDQHSDCLDSSKVLSSESDSGWSLWALEMKWEIGPPSQPRHQTMEVWHEKDHLPQINLKHTWNSNCELNETAWWKMRELCEMRHGNEARLTTTPMKSGHISKLKVVLLYEQRSGEELHLHFFPWIHEILFRFSERFEEWKF